MVGSIRKYSQLEHVEPLNILASNWSPWVDADQRALVSVNILLSYLKDFDILLAPADSSRRFVWLRPLFEIVDAGKAGSTREKANAIDSDELKDSIDPSTLYLCTANVAQMLLEKYSQAFFLVLTYDGDVPEWARLNGKRVILVRTTNRMAYMGALIQNLFTSLLVWEGSLERIVSAQGSITDLLNEGAVAMGCFMALTDSGFNDIAHTTIIEPPANAFAQLVETGCYTPDMVEHIETDVLPRCRNARMPMVDHRRNDAEPDLLHYPIYYHGSYFFHLIMVCKPGVSVRAAYDLLVLFVDHLAALCSSFWDELIMVKSPWHRLLTNLIDGVPMNEKYIMGQLEIMSVNPMDQFCLVCFKLDNNDLPTKRLRVNDAVAALNGGLCFPFAYNGCLLVLFYSGSHMDAPFSLQGVVHDIASHPVLSGKLKVGVSEPFDNIKKIGVAASQALMAVNFSTLIDEECKLCGKKRSHFCYSFSSVMPYYLLVSSMRSNELVSACFFDGMLEKLSIEDRELDTEVVRLLWTYLCLERNATAAGKQLHMHRNTVLYHIEKIERRFRISLDDFVTRMELLDEFRVYFLTDGFTHEIDYDALLNIEHPRQRTLS